MESYKRLIHTTSTSVQNRKSLIFRLHKLDEGVIQCFLGVFFGAWQNKAASTSFSIKILHDLSKTSKEWQLICGFGRRCSSSRRNEIEIKHEKNRKKNHKTLPLGGELVTHVNAVWSAHVNAVWSAHVNAA